MNYFDRKLKLTLSEDEYRFDPDEALPDEDLFQDEVYERFVQESQLFTDTSVSETKIQDALTQFTDLVERTVREGIHDDEVQYYQRAIDTDELIIERRRRIMAPQGTEIPADFNGYYCKWTGWVSNRLLTEHWSWDSIQVISVVMGNAGVEHNLYMWMPETKYYEDSDLGDIPPGVGI